ncbi:hypothetical protein DENSPDRAFT_261365 [Dentipellis sp. KUC8613]|nr:hypothetical protein DENSPDRAFT_261365 [Dentipellis sp. KUC8613]
MSPSRGRPRPDCRAKSFLLSWASPRTTGCRSPYAWAGGVRVHSCTGVFFSFLHPWLVFATRRGRKLRGRVHVLLVSKKMLLNNQRNTTDHGRWGPRLKLMPSDIVRHDSFMHLYLRIARH